VKILFARHGESEANLLNEFSNRGFKHGLTEKGEAQALALAQKLGRLSVSRVFSSPLMRAVQTAEILARALDAAYEIVDALREYDCGVLEGRSDAVSWAEYQRVLEEWITHHRWESRIEGGESFIEIKERFVPFIEDLMEEYGGSQAVLVLVGHGGLYRCMLPLILENVDFGFTLRHLLNSAGYVEARSLGGELTCVSWQGEPCLGMVTKRSSPGEPRPHSSAQSLPGNRQIPDSALGGST
jgi:probable phosphoglycerate mutase